MQYKIRLSTLYFNLINRELVILQRLKKIFDDDDGLF